MNPFRQISAHTRAVLQALLVTFLWSTSWVLIKFGLTGIPPLTFAGLRYSLASPPWEVNGLRPYPWTIAMKPLRKVSQWWKRP